MATRTKKNRQAAASVLAGETNHLRLMDPTEYAGKFRQASLRRVWLSRLFLVQEHDDGPGKTRLSVNRTAVEAGCKFADGISWDELQWIKRECGYGDRWAVECFPADEHVVNVANMRHLWLLDDMPVFGWTKGV